MKWNLPKSELYRMAVIRMYKWCKKTDLPCPPIQVILRDNWYFDACAYYRPDTEVERKYLDRSLATKGYGPGVNICLERCQVPCGPESSRNWSWPGSAVDRTPYGVVAHELGHHVDWCLGEKKGRYFSDFSVNVRKQSKEAPLTGYCDNDAEWFAEMFRLFFTNPHLLCCLRPITYGLLHERLVQVDKFHWQTRLGEDCPERVVKSLFNKGAKV